MWPFKKKYPHGVRVRVVETTTGNFVVERALHWSLYFRSWTYVGEYNSLENAKKSATDEYYHWIDFYEERATLEKTSKDAKAVWWFP